MDKLKIGYFADGSWSHMAFEKIVKDDTIKIQFIVPRTDSTDKTLLNYAKKYNIQYFKGIKVNSDEFYDLAKTFECDLFVSMSFNQIFKERIINLPKHKIINCHAGKLPFYRGRNILNWALINDEVQFGITVHYVDLGIDTGDIILQRVFPITDEDNYSTLLEKSYLECSSILYDAIKTIQRFEVKAIKQSTIHPIGFYCGKRGYGDEIINWNQTSREIFNFIRSISKPGPIATTFFKGAEIRINKSKIVNDVPKYKGTVGQLLAKTEKGFLIKTNDSFIEIYEIETKIKISVGDKLGL